MRGIDQDDGQGGREADCDPGPVSVLGEIQALMADRPTFELRWTLMAPAAKGVAAAFGYELTRRDPWRIRGRPVGTKGMDVLVGHECDSVTVFDNSVTYLRDTTVNAPLPDKAPY